MAQSAIDHFIDELNYGVYEQHMSCDYDEPPVKLAIKSSFPRSILTPNQNLEEARLFFELSETTFTKAYIGFQTSQSMAYPLIHQLLDFSRQSNCAITKFASLKALYALVRSGDKGIFAHLLAKGILGQALSFLQASHDQYMETYSVLILCEIYQNENNGLDDVTKEGIVQQLIEAGNRQLVNPEEDTYLRQNVIWVIGKLFQTTFQPQSTISNKLQDFMKFLLEQSFNAERVWDPNFTRTLSITLSALNKAGKFQFLDNILCKGMQKMVEDCPANYVTNLKSCFTFYFIDYTTPEYSVSGRNPDIRASKLATLQKMMTNLTTVLERMEPVRMTELHPALNNLFYLFSLFCREKKALLWESGCFPFFVTLFAHGVQHNVVNWYHIRMMRRVVEDATLGRIRCLFAAGLSDALQEYGKGFKNGIIDASLKTEFDAMIEQLLVKLNQFQEFDLIQTVLWPETKDKKEMFQ